MADRNDRIRGLATSAMRAAAQRLVGKNLGTPPSPASLRAMIFVLTGTLPPEDIEALPRERLRAFADALKRALKRERGKARSGHRSYDVNRHIALHQALRGIERLVPHAVADNR